jgi:hypothetical protein
MGLSTMVLPGLPSVFYYYMNQIKNIIGVKNIRQTWQGNSFVSLFSIFPSLPLL